MEIKVTNSEWYIMDILWNDFPQTLMQIVEKCKERNQWSKSTCSTMVRRMNEKGLIRYELEGRTKLFYPIIKKEEVVIKETKDFVNRIYQGSVGMMMSTLVRQDGLTESEIEELENIIKQYKENH